MSWRELLPPWLVIVAGLTGIVLLCVSTKDVPIAPLRTKYGIVLDASPSRTILFIYQWTTTKANKTGVIKECSSCTVQGPEISNYSDSPQKVGKSLDTCLNWAQSKIPAEQHSQTPLYLGAATSIMQLNLSHPTRSDDLLAALTVALKSSPFDFQGVQILSSPDKEAFNWVAVNYILENFFKYDWRGQMVPSTNRMAGVLSIGGTSTQLTSKVEEGNQIPKDGVRLQLYEQTHTVYTHHCPCHGTDQLRSRLLSTLIQEQRSSKTVPNPCWPLSYSQEVQWNSVHTGPCAVSDDTLDIPNPDQVFNITGTSNPTACMRLVQSLLNSSSSCSFFNNSPKSADKLLQTRFLVISEAMDFLRKTAPSPDLGQAVNKLCEMSVKELVKESQTSLDALADYCTVSAFIFQLSTKGYISDFNQSIQAAFQIGDTSSVWTLGYLLSLTNTIPQDSPSFLKGIDPGVWSLLLILFVVLLTGSFMRISYRVMVKENSRSNRNSSVFDDN
ncbi:ectonucleoside triphosphate diphosphohydrolase 2-like [Coturnix japonica]|uniref:Ectonucleoside triphosphate diphosphohydrolase 2-like n=1 Tax=Coturnix japonica TaxID=93934 RepID=A0A8C2U685_COTJA|nr:ectonucleoside triphosphate diphosphohydrolase 2-like [Coturnix japonica]